MTSRQIAIRFENDGEDAHVPLVYLACRLTNTTKEQRKLLDSWCTHVEQALTEASGDSDQPWEVAVHVPLKWSAPGTDTRSPETIFSLNSATVNRCAAVIILCVEGGGLGVGQEFAWAVSLRLPILLLHPVDQAPSRQAIGTSADVTVVGFENASELVESAKAFVRENRAVIEDWKRRTDSLNIALVPLRETLAEKWHRLGHAGHERVQAESRVHLRRIQQLVDDDHALAGASMSEVLAIIGAMGIDAPNIFANPGMPDLNARQRAALGVAADEYEWLGSDVLTLETRARLELSRGGTRRLSLVTPADWVQFRNQTAGHD